MMRSVKFLMASALWLLTGAACFGGTDPLDQWTWRNPVPTGEQLNSVVFGDNQFVAVGNRSTIATSPDGSVWTLVDLGDLLDDLVFGDFGEFQSVTYLNGRLVAIGSGGTSVTSTNGSKWTRSYVALDRLMSVGSGKGEFIAVGNGIATSVDGTNWVNRLVLTDNFLMGVAFGAGRYVAVGSQGMILSSEDGVRWTNRESGTPLDLQSVAYGNGTFVATAYGALGRKALISSADGLTWKNLNPDFLLENITFCGGGFVASSGAGIRTSQDGIAWEFQPLPALSKPQAFAFGNSRFVGVGNLVGYSGQIFTSPDAKTWRKISTTTTASFRSIACNGSQWVAVGIQSGSESDNTAVATSIDGVHWTQMTSQETVSSWPERQRVVYGGGKFVAVTGGAQILSSTNGTNWTNIWVGDDINLTGLAFGKSTFVAVGSAGPTSVAVILTSPDGIQWTRRDPKTTSRLSVVTFGDSQFVACGDLGTILASPDGSDWSPRKSGVSGPIESMAYGNGRFVALVTESKDGANHDRGSLTSSDGVAWAYSGSVIKGDINYGDITFGANQFVGVFGIFPEENSRVVTSSDGVTWTDGLNWTGGHRTFYAHLHGIGYGDGRFTVVGDWGAILQSGPFIGLAINPLPATGLLSLSVMGPAGSDCVIQASQDLGTWLDVANITVSPSGRVVFDGLPITEKRKFYRVQAR